MAAAQNIETSDRGQPVSRNVQVQRYSGAAGAVAVGPAPSRKPLPMEPLHDSGQSVTGAFEGWFPNPDGTFSILFGYFNRNLKRGTGYSDRAEQSDRAGWSGSGPAHALPDSPPVGRLHRHGAEGFRRQETHLDTGRQRHRPPTIPRKPQPAMGDLAFPQEGTGNTPPTLAFAEAGPSVQGPRGHQHATGGHRVQSAPADPLGCRRRQDAARRQRPRKLRRWSFGGASSADPARSPSPIHVRR